MKRSATSVLPSQTVTLARKEWIITETLTVMATATANAAMVTAFRCRERPRCWAARRTIQPGPRTKPTKRFTDAGTSNEKPAINKATEAKPRNFPPPWSAPQESPAERRRATVPQIPQWRDSWKKESPRDPGRRTRAGSQAAASAAGRHAARSEAPRPTAKAKRTWEGARTGRSMVTKA